VDSVEEVWTNFKAILRQGIEKFVPHRIQGKNSDPECYNREVKPLKVKVRKAYNRRILGRQYRGELKRLSKRLLLAKKNAQESFLRSILKNVGEGRTKFYKYVKKT
jgi:hypothetical protein